MSNQPTDKSKYPSRYSPKAYVTAAQYIIELVCEKKAKFDRTELPIQFWKLAQWRNFFMRNLRQTHKLLKGFDAKAIINALNLQQFSNSYSIFTERFLGLVEQEQGRLDEQLKIEVVKEEVNRNTIDNKIRPSVVKPNLLSKLDNI